MDNRILNFFRRIVFGTNYKADNANDINMICGCCFVAAWKDMARTYKKGDGKKRAKLKDEFLEDLTMQVLNKKYEPRKIIFKYKNQNKLTLGQSQKVVNMFFKYLYTFTDSPMIDKEQFVNCDCPIDSIILEKIAKKKRAYKDITLTKKGKLRYKKQPYVWSKIDNDELYEQLQQMICEISNGSNLDFDFDEWA